MIHERIRDYTGFNDMWPLLAVALVHAACVAYFFVKGQISYNTLKYLFLGGVCFVFMAVFDVLMHHRSFLRLSLEDLFKLWSSFFLFLYSYSFFRERSENNNSSNLLES